MIADPDWSACSRLIADVHAVKDTSSIGTEEVDQAVKIFASAPAALRGKRGAAIAADTFGRASRLSQLVARFGALLVVFNNLDTACTFLDIDLTEARGTIEQLRSRLRSQE
jgi:hypothetical protein